MQHIESWQSLLQQSCTQTVVNSLHIAFWLLSSVFFLDYMTVAARDTTPATCSNANVTACSFAKSLFHIWFYFSIYQIWGFAKTDNQPVAVLTADKARWRSECFAATEETKWTSSADARAESSAPVPCCTEIRRTDMSRRAVPALPKTHRQPSIYNSAVMLKKNF